MHVVGSDRCMTVTRSRSAVELAYEAGLVEPAEHSEPAGNGAI